MKNKIFTIFLAITLIVSLIPSLSFADTSKDPLWVDNLQIKAESGGEPLSIVTDVNDKWIVSVPSGTDSIFISGVEECGVPYICDETFEFFLIFDEASLGDGDELAQANENNEYEVKLEDFGTADCQGSCQ